MTANDSIDVTLSIDHNPVEGGPNLGSSTRQNSDGKMGGRLRYRPRVDSILVLWVDLDFPMGPFDSIPYSLRFRTISSVTPPVAGQFASVTIDGEHEYDEFSLAPLSLAARHPPDDRKRWAAFVGHYRVAVAPDSLYELCKLPCVKPDTIVLKPGSVFRRRL